MLKNTQKTVNSSWHKLEITHIIKETSRAVTITLEFPNHQLQLFFHSGQYINIVVEIDGKSYCRSYSISSAPYEEVIRITVQRVAGGVVSNYLNADAKVGDTLMCSQPCGDFLIKTTTKPKIFIAAGSGITPIISLLKSQLYNSSDPCHMFYFSRSNDETIFKNEISSHCQLYNEKLYVCHWYSGSQGRFDFDLTKLSRLNDVLLTAPDIYICGPNEWMENFLEALKPYRFCIGTVYKEYFTAIESLPTEKKEEITTHSMSIKIDNTVHVVDVNSNESLLSALLRNDIPVTYGCELGKCGCCIAKIVSGQIDNSRINFLTPEELGEGFTLCCQASAKSNCELEKH